jgi:hypothetical protein
LALVTYTWAWPLAPRVSNQNAEGPKSEEPTGIALGYVYAQGGPGGPWQHNLGRGARTGPIRSPEAPTAHNPHSWPTPVACKSQRPHDRRQQDCASRDSDRRSGAPASALRPASRTGGLNAASVIHPGVPKSRPGAGRRRPARPNLRQLHLRLDVTPPLPRISPPPAVCRDSSTSAPHAEGSNSKESELRRSLA